MDLSALIFVALAVAWAVYLVPKALRHHDDVVRSRSVERFSHSMRVLARREPVSKKSARLVVTPGRPAAEATVATKPHHRPEPQRTAEAQQVPVTPDRIRAQRAAAKRATKRRRNVLALILLANLATVGVAAFGVIAWWYVAIPAGLLVAWLVTCRIMVKGERSRLVAPSSRIPVEVETPEEVVVEEEETEAEETDEVDPLADTSAGMAAVVDPALWDPVPVTLPTYVGKPAATRRTVRTIDLEGTGVWTSGRTEVDAALAREADEADRAAREARDSGNGERATGS
ncbi:divisome protein SepX/GlpR [Nocardioides pyridinolyticus]